jgi:hypothetical protein
MSRLAIDACAALHAKQTGSLAVLDCFIEHAMTPVISQGVYGEAVTMTLSAWLGAHRVEPQRVPRQQTNAVRNECDRHRMPGKKDLELLALAKARGVPVLTHDLAATDATRRIGLLALDLVDIIAFAHEQGWVDEPRLAALSQRLDDLAWHAQDWRGDVRRTISGRPRFDRTAAALSACLT